MVNIQSESVPIFQEKLRIKAIIGATVKEVLFINTLAYDVIYACLTLFSGLSGHDGLPSLTNIDVEGSFARSTPPPRTESGGEELRLEED